MKLYYDAWHYSLRAAAPVLTSIKVQGLHHVPPTGAAILVCNHISMADPAILIAYVKRHIHFIIKDELLDHLVYRIVLPLGDPIPVHRGKADRVALRQAEAVLKEGGVLGIFPEGTRNLSGETQEAHTGVVFLAQRTGAPIVPIGISGTERILSPRFPWFRRAPVQLTFGPPFTLAELHTEARADRHVLARAIMLRVAALLPPRYRGIYAQWTGQESGIKDQGSGVGDQGTEHQASTEVSPSIERPPAVAGDPGARLLTPDSQRAAPSPQPPSSDS